MGSYYGVHIRVTTKPDAHPNAVNNLRAMLLGDEPDGLVHLDYSGYTDLNIREEFKVHEAVLSELTCMSRHESAYFETWKQQTATEQEDGSIVFETFGSTKCPEESILCMFLDRLKGNLKLEHGQILARFIYEESSRETVVFYHELTDKFLITEGWVHKPHANLEGCYPDVTDLPTHPYNDDEHTVQTFVPPMNLFEFKPVCRNAEYYTNIEEYSNCGVYGHFSEFVIPE